MLRIFRSGSPVSLVIVLAFCIVLRIPTLLTGTEDFLSFSSGPLSVWFYQLISTLPWDTSLTLGILSILIVFVQAIWINQVLLKYKIFETDSYLPSLVYVLVMSVAPAFTTCTPALLSLTFFIPAMDRLFSTFKEESCFMHIFDASLYLGVAALTYMPNLTLLFFVLATLISLRNIDLREMLVSIIGFMTPLFLVFTIFFVQGRGAELWYNFVQPYFVKGYALSLPDMFEGMEMVLILLILVPATLAIGQSLFASLIQFRKFISMVVFLGIAVLFSVFLVKDHYFNHFALFMLPLSIGFYAFIRKYEDSYIGTLMLASLFLLILALQYLPYFYGPQSATL